MEVLTYAEWKEWGRTVFRSKERMKIALLQVADTGPLESLKIMLESVGYECYLPDQRLRGILQKIGCDTVLDPQHLVTKWGYDPPSIKKTLSEREMRKVDLFVDVKAQKNYTKLITQWRNLEKRVLWYRINGGKPQHVINHRGDHGDEINPPCPVLTPNQWYKIYDPKFQGEQDTEVWKNNQIIGYYYCCWPPFAQWGDYQYPRVNMRGDGKAESPRTIYESPICLVHNFKGWGYGNLQNEFQKLGVMIYGLGSPDGLINHREIPVRLTKAIAMVHMKSNDAPGYAIYEALASGCPLICTEALIWKCRMQELLIPGKTCLTFHRETHEGLTQKDVEECTSQVKEHLENLRNPEYNQEIGEAGRKRLKEIMWSEKDIPSLDQFMKSNFAQ